jgi:hypothetical protein
MFIPEPTPNPQLSFLPGRTVLASGLSMRDQKSAAQSPLGKPARHHRHFRRVLFLDFIAVTKASGEWQQLASGARRHHGAFHVRAPIVSADGVAASESDEFFAAEDPETVATIKELIECASCGRK